MSHFRSVSSATAIKSVSFGSTTKQNKVDPKSILIKKPSAGELKREPSGSESDEEYYERITKECEQRGNPEAPIKLLTIPKDVDELAEEAMDDWYNGIFGHPGEPGVTIWQVRVSPRCKQRGSRLPLRPSRWRRRDPRRRRRDPRKYRHRTRSSQLVFEDL